MVRIENWSIVEIADPYTAPEARSCALAGEIYGHPHFPDGKNIRTSRIIGVSKEKEIVKCSSRDYVLGEIDPGYEKKYPGARDRILSTIPEVTELQ